MPSVKVYSQDGKELESMKLDPKVFDVTPNPGLIEQAIVTTLANRRQVLAHTKGRGEVRGGGKKPWRQKGTGRARHGSIRSPIWKGGGIVHGPRKTRVYAKKMNAVSRRAALLMALSDKVNHNRLFVLDALEFSEAKTKLFAAAMKKLPAGKTNLIVLPESNPTLVRTGRNVPGVRFIRADSLNVYDVVAYQRLMVLKNALPVISKTYAKK